MIHSDILLHYLTDIFIEYNNYFSKLKLSNIHIRTPNNPNFYFIIFALQIFTQQQ